MTQLRFDIVAPQIWNHIPVEDPRAARIYDRHYSRQSHGARGVMGPGRRFLLLHEDAGGSALWGVIYNLFRDERRFRNAIFRNESSAISSSLIIAATLETYALWRRRYVLLPVEPLETEIDIEATRRRRARRHPPGYCYERAGWEWHRSTLATHGRSAKAIYRAPPPTTEEA